MRIIEQVFQVRFQYPVVFTRDLFHSENEALAQIIDNNTTSERSKALIVLDEGMLVHHPELESQIHAYFQNLKRVDLAGKLMILPGGEAVKNNPAWVEELLVATDRYKIDRHSYLIAIGGGALLDMAGYAASIAHRGVRHIRIPTTVLSQNDSGIGVKNSVNYFGKKNYLGNFDPPYAVLNDALFLATLSDRDWRSGISEAIKVALIKDASYFEWMERQVQALVDRNLDVMEELVFVCAKLHLEHIAGGDPFEKGSSRPLDFGHWAAHKLEALSGFDIRHGEAVAIGIALDAAYSYLTGRLSYAAFERIAQFIAALGFELFHPLLLERHSDILLGLKEFQEHLGGRLTIMLLEDIGKGVEVHEMDAEKIYESLILLQSLRPQPQPLIR